jgi:AcrR family transcriptional regulator
MRSEVHWKQKIQKMFPYLKLYISLRHGSEKREIITQATAIYLKFGIKSVTMDEMARQLGISKKTLYSYVADKNELVEQCVLLEHEGEVCQIGEINKQFENAIDEMLAISRYVAGTLKKFILLSFLIWQSIIQTHSKL